MEDDSFFYYLEPKQPIFIIVMQNRGTYANAKLSRTNQKITTKQIRSTFNPNNSLTKGNNQEKSGNNVDKMISKILDVINKLHNFTQTKVITRENIKSPSTKIFFDIVSIFMKGICGKFERDELTVDVVIDYCKLFGYTGNLNHNIFKPIGAPHTWVFCLAILEWLSELANYAYNFQAVKQDKPFDEDLNSHILDTFNTQDAQNISQYITRDIKRYKEELENTQYSIQTMQLALKNIHFSQRDVSEVEKEIDKQKEIIFRVKQEIIQKERQEEKLKKGLDKTRIQSKDLDQQILKMNKTCSQLQYEVQHQQLTVQQTEDLKRQLVQLDKEDYMIKIRQSNYNTTYLREADEHLREVNQVLRELKDSHSKIVHIVELGNLGIDLNTPIIDLKDYEEYLKIDSILYDDISQRDIVADTIITSYSRKFDETVKTMQLKITKLQETQRGMNQQLGQIENTKKRLKKQIEQYKGSFNKQSDHKMMLEDTLHETSLKIQEKTRSRTNINLFIQTKLDKKNQYENEINECKEKIRLLKAQITEFDTITAAQIKFREAQLQEYKRTTLKSIEDYRMKVEDLHKVVKTASNSD